ncbi:MAG TPA: FG-GAP-like repeat-containing protein [Xanthomonadaceae bacterium]|jgi:hypothetical protein|nr:FG-GAP-like repeat-containing protein [Xanthomonadaceae bacterium]
MRLLLLAAAVSLGLVACAEEAADGGQGGVMASALRPAASLAAPQRKSHIADLPDRGDLLAYANTAPVRRGHSVWYPVQLSEARAIRAIAEGGMTIPTPSGEAIQLKYARHVEHRDGNWTWVGRLGAGGSGPEAVFTFGPDAVFATLPATGGRQLEITTQGGRTWLVSTDTRSLSDPAGNSRDSFLPPAHEAGSAAIRRLAASAPVRADAAMPRQPVAAEAPTSQSATIDLVLGYTTAFATRLGGTSQALTRLNHLVDLANQALINSRVGAQIRLQEAVAVDYPDATSNRSALFALSGQNCSVSQTGSVPQLPDAGVSCSNVGVPAALQPLVDARDRNGADLASLVRVFSDEHGSCGVAWLLGAGRTLLDASLAPYALSVVSDSNGSQFPSGSGNSCRNDSLAHEIGHNLGLQHNVETARGSDDTNNDGDVLDPEEYGRFTASFGYRTGASEGNFYTVMANRLSGQTPYLIFSNPRVTTCGGFPCGVENQADNAATLVKTATIVASFRQPLAPGLGVAWRGDYNGDGRSDVLWHNTLSGAGIVWNSANSSTRQSISTVPDTAWFIAANGDFDGDGRSDVLWRNIGTGANVIWRAASASAPLAVTTVEDQNWVIAAVGDFDGNGSADIFWRNPLTGQNTIWRGASSAARTAVASVTDPEWTVVAAADFDGDNRDDILWHNDTSGASVIWRSGTSTSRITVSTVGDVAWKIVGAGDFDGDGKADIFWRNRDTGQNALWKGGKSANGALLTTITDFAWVPVGLGDFDGDGSADILWRHNATGQNVIWRSGNASTRITVTPVSDLQWVISG